MNNPNGIAVDAAGTFSLQRRTGERVREIRAATGLISTVAGTGTWGNNGDGIPATQAELAVPEGVELDAAGNIYIVDAGYSQVREVDAKTGLISTVAGTLTDGYNGDGIPAGSAELFDPADIAFDSAGDLFIADLGNLRVRELVTGNAPVTVTPASPTVTVGDAGGTFAGSPFAAEGTALGVDGVTPVGGSFTFTYYVGNTASGNGSSTAPTDAGTYTVVADFTSSDGNYTPATSQPVVFTIAKASPRWSSAIRPGFTMAVPSRRRGPSRESSPAWTIRPAAH